MQARCLLFEFQRHLFSWRVRDRAEAPTVGRNGFFNRLVASSFFFRRLVASSLSFSDDFSPS